MPASNPTPGTPSDWPHGWVLLALLAAGFAARLALAGWTFLNPDEALHYWLSVQPSLRLAYQASLTTLHPPLLILFLYCWRSFGHYEWVLRLPSVLAGVGFAWLSFKWLDQIADRKIATLTLILLLFSPSLIALTAEVRQYPLLLIFISASVYYFDRAVIQSSCAMMAVSGTALILALLTHYSALLVAPALGIYGLLRLYPLRHKRGLVGIWLGTQIACLAMCAYLFAPHIAMLHTKTMAQGLADTWLRSSIFHPGEVSWLFFFGRQTLRLFRYQFAQPAVAPVGLILYVWGIVLLFRSKLAHPHTPTPRQLGALLIAPLLINLASSGVYPYGGTRHNSFLALFVMTPASFALGSLRFGSQWAVPAIVTAVLAISNISPSPGGPYIHLQDQRKKLMLQATDFLRKSASPGATILSDYQGALVLGYYLCDARVAPIEPLPDPFPRSSCASYNLVTTEPDRWSFKAKDFPVQIAQIAVEQHLTGESELWLFQTGWGIVANREWPPTLASLCRQPPARFGRDLSICRIRLDETLPR
jgi:dolichyl-phosphate-mannose-protein mannosyltransferase